MSEIRANTISDAAGTGPVTLTKQSAAKALWFYEQATPAVISSFNVSSITDVSTGRFTVNWTSAFNSANYTVPSSAGFNGAGGGTILANVIGPTYSLTPYTASSGTFDSVNTGGAGSDSRSNGSAFGDLA